MLRGLFVFVVVVLASTVNNAQAEPFCAIQLHVELSDGLPFRSTWIELVDSSGNTELRQEMVGPDLRICDFGFGVHTLRVGVNECFPVAISNLRLEIDHPIHLRVLLNPCALGSSAGNSCRLYFRVSNDHYEHVSGVTVSRARSLPLPTTDIFGRTQGYLMVGRGADVVFSKSGYRSESIHVECRAYENIERNVVLHDSQ